MFGVRQDASGVCLVPVCTTRVGVPHPVLRAVVGVERAEEGSSGSGTTDSAAFCGIAAAADSRDGGACTGG